MADSLAARPCTEADWPALFPVVEGAFLSTLRSEDEARYRAVFATGRYHGIYDGELLVGGGGVLTRQLTVPGAGPRPVAAVTLVGVAPDQRRRGILRTLMRAQLHDLHDAGAEPVAALWASQGGIYGRFGYGTAVWRAALSVPARSAYRPGVRLDGRVRMVSVEQAAPVLRAVHTATASTRPGWLSRPEASWSWWMADLEHQRKGASAFHHALHSTDGVDDGYAVFRTTSKWTTRGPSYRLSVHELAAAGPAAHAGLWRFLLDLDLVGEVEQRIAPVDDPLPLLLADPSAAVRELSDGLWVRLVDLDRALAARRYAAPCDLVLEVSDALCPWNAGRWRLRVDGKGVAAMQRCAEPAALACDIADLGAAYLGGTRLTALAAAGRVREHRPDAVVTAARAFAADVEPYCPEIF